MGTSANHFWIRIAIGVALIAFAVLAFRRSRPLLWFTLLFGAAHFLLEAGVAARSLPFMILGGAVYAANPLVLAWDARGRRKGRSVATLILALGAALLVDAWFRFRDADLIPKPIDTDRWGAADQLKLTRPGPLGFLVKAERFRGRMMDWRGEIRADWPPLGGHDERVIVIENAGPFDQYRVIEGDADLREGPGSRMALTCRFTKREGACRVGIREWAGPRTTIGLAWGTAGDHDLLAKMVGSLAERGPDLLVGLGGLIRPGNYGDLLAARDAFDSAGSRAVFVPGGAEAPASGPCGFASHLGLQGRHVHACGLSLLKLDTSEGTTDYGDTEKQPGMLLISLLGATSGVPAIATRYPLMGPPGREADLLPDTAAREALVRRLKEWRTKLVLATTEGPGWDLDVEGIRHVTLGRGPGKVDAAVVTVEGGAVSGVTFLEGRASGLSGQARSWWRRLRALSEEHPGPGQRFAFGLAAGVLSLAFLGAGLVRRRPDPEAPSGSIPSPNSQETLHAG